MQIGSRRPAVAATLFVLLSAARAHGQSNEAAATALFDEGRKLMAQHHYADACSKLAESERLAPSGGTLLNLAECYEHTGQTASAWVAWKDAAARANSAGKADAERKALARITALEPGLSRLTIDVGSGSDVSGLEIKRDGMVIGRAAYGSAIPVDPGPHRIEASAPKRKEWSTVVEVASKQTDARVTVTLSPEVPATQPTLLIPEPAPVGGVPRPTDAAPLATSSQSGSPQRVLGVVTLSAGVAGVAVGSVFGLLAVSKNNEALQAQNCSTSRVCNQTGLSLTADAKDAATVSTIAFAVGAAAIGGGLILWLTAPNAPSSSTGVRLTPTLGPSYAGASISHAW